MEISVKFQLYVRPRLAKMQRKKAPVIDDIVIERLTVLTCSGIDKVTEWINEIYDRGETPEIPNLHRASIKKPQRNQVKMIAPSIK